MCGDEREDGADVLVGDIPLDEAFAMNLRNLVQVTLWAHELEEVKAFLTDEAVQDVFGKDIENRAKRDKRPHPTEHWQEVAWKELNHDDTRMIMALVFHRHCHPNPEAYEPFTNRSLAKGLDPGRGGLQNRLRDRLLPLLRHAGYVELSRLPGSDWVQIHLSEQGLVRYKRYIAMCEQDHLMINEELIALRRGRKEG